MCECVRVCVLCVCLWLGIDFVFAVEVVFERLAYMRSARTPKLPLCASISTMPAILRLWRTLPELTEADAISAIYGVQLIQMAHLPIVITPTSPHSA